MMSIPLITLLLIALAAVIVLLVVLVLLFRKSVQGSASESSTEITESLSRIQAEKNEAERRLAAEEQKAVRVPVLEEENRKLVLQIDALREEKARVDQSLAARIENVTSLQESDRIFRQNLIETEAALATLQERFEKQMQEKSTGEAALAEVRGTLGMTLESLEDVRRRLAIEESKSRETLVKVGQVQEEKAKVDETLAARNENVASLQESEKSLRKTLGETEGARAALQERFESLMQEKASVESSLAEARESLGKTAETLGEIRTRLATEETKSKDALARAIQVQEEKAKVDELLAARTENVSGLQESDRSLRLVLKEAEGAHAVLQERIETLILEKAECEASMARLGETLEQERKQADEKVALLLQAKEQMAAEFKCLAEEVMAKHGESFSRQNKEQIDGVLVPLKDKIAEFQLGLQAAQTDSARDRATLAEQIRTLSESSAQMSTETQNLTRALKGKAQTQGAWGEMILTTILERSGLREGEEFLAQKSHTTEDGARVRPDVIVNIPGGEKIIIDSKVSLKAFEEFVNAGSPTERATALQRHVASMKAHIKALGGKDYQIATDSGLDYVLMFVPIEGALATAIQEEPELTSYAAEMNVAIATPTTLMIALRTVANVWKVERRNQNAEAIAKRAGLLYDKFVGFIHDMRSIKSHLGQTTTAFDNAMNKLSSGKGNLVTQAEQLKQLGARSSKSLRGKVDYEEEGVSAPLTPIVPEAALESEAIIVSENL